MNQKSRGLGIVAYRKIIKIVKKHAKGKFHAN